MRHAMFLFQIILSADNIIYETRTRSGHVYQIQIAPIFLSSALNIMLPYIIIMAHAFHLNSQFPSARRLINTALFWPVNQNIYVEEVVTVCQKPPAMQANFRGKQNSVLLSTCLVLVVVHEEAILL